MEETTEKTEFVGKYKSTQNFKQFAIYTGTRIRFVIEEATINAEKLGIMQSESVTLKMKIGKDGTFDLTEVSTNFISEEQMKRLAEQIDERSKELRFTTEDGRTCMIDADYQKVKPIDKLRALAFGDEDEVPQISEKTKSKLSAIFDDLDFSDVEEETKEEEVEEVKFQKPVVKSTREVIAENFKNEEKKKLEELKSRLTKLKKEHSITKSDFTFGEKKMKSQEEEIKNLEARIDSMSSKSEPNGMVFSVSEVKKSEEVDQSLMEAIEKLAPILKLNVPVVVDMVKKGHYVINVANKDDFEKSNFTSEVFEELQTTFGSENITIQNGSLVYSGELKWHDILDKMIRKGFEQSADFDKHCGNGKKEEEHSCGDKDCSGDCK